MVTGSIKENSQKYIKRAFDGNLRESLKGQYSSNSMILEVGKKSYWWKLTQYSSKNNTIHIVLSWSEFAK